jgi:hypothetical protein
MSMIWRGTRKRWEVASSASLPSSTTSRLPMKAMLTLPIASRHDGRDRPMNRHRGLVSS